MKWFQYTKKVITTSLIVSLVFILTGPVTVFAAGPAGVNLGSSGNFVILTKSGISTTGSTVITGDIGVSPISATAITGFGLIADSSNTFSTSALVTGKVYAADYTPPTPTIMTTAVSDMETAYTDAAGRTNPTATELGSGNIGGMTLAPGLYKWGTDVTIPMNVTLSGGVDDVWIFQIAQNLTISSATNVVLGGGAQASNIFWQVAGQATLGTNSVFNGNILGQTAIVLNTGATLNGRALAQTEVTLDANIVTVPSSVSGYSTPPPPPAPPTSSPAPTPTPTTIPSPTTSSAADAALRAQLQVQVDELLALVQSLNVQVQARKQGSFVSGSAFGQQVRAIAVNLVEGNRGNDVKILQDFLISQNRGSAAQSLANVGATAYFGTLTRAALAEFQAQTGINPPLGNFGPITRSYISAY